MGLFSFWSFKKGTPPDEQGLWDRVSRDNTIGDVTKTPRVLPPPVIQAPSAARPQAPAGAVPPVIPGSGHNYNGTKYYNYEDIKPPVGSEHGYWNYEGMGTTAKTGKFRGAASKVGALIVEHPGKATGIAALVTAMAIWLWPNNKQKDTQQPDGSVQTERKWGGFKKTAVTVGAVLSAALVAQHIPGPTKSWVSKVLGATAKAATHVR